MLGSGVPAAGGPGTEGRAGLWLSVVTYSRPVHRTPDICRVREGGAGVLGKYRRLPREPTGTPVPWRCAGGCESPDGRGPCPCLGGGFLWLTLRSSC